MAKRAISAVDRRGVLKAAGAAGVIGLAGCIGEEAEEDEDDDLGVDDEETEEAADGEQLTFHAGGTGGTYYPLAGEFQQLVENNTGHSINVQSTGASVENVGSLGDGTADFALIQNDIAYFAREGTGLEEFEGNPIENIRGVASIYPETLHIVTQAGSGIEELTDLEGQSVNTGDLGSGTQVNALQILEAAGISADDIEEQNTDFEGAADQIRDGDIDASVTVGGWPVGAVEELATTSDIDFVEISGEVRDAALDEAEWLSEDTIPGGTYGGVEDDVETVAMQAMIATNEELDAEIVEEVTAAIFDNVDEISTQAEFIDLETAQEGMSIELHEGAAAYFDE